MTGNTRNHCKSCAGIRGNTDFEVGNILVDTDHTAPPMGYTYGTVMARNLWDKESGIYDHRS